MGTVYITQEPCTLASFEAAITASDLKAEIFQDRVFFIRSAVGAKRESTVLMSLCEPRERLCSDGKMHIEVLNYAAADNVITAPGEFVLVSEHLPQFEQLTSTTLNEANAAVVAGLLVEQLGMTEDHAAALAAIADIDAADTTVLTTDNTTVDLCEGDGKTDGFIAVLVDGGEIATICPEKLIDA
jgi:hypothetical protein